MYLGEFVLEAQAVPDPAEGDGHLGLDGLYRNSQQLRYVGVFEALFLGQLKDEPAFGRQGIGAGHDLSYELGRDHHVFGIEEHTVHLNAPFIHGGQLPAAIGLDAVERQVLDAYKEKKFGVLYLGQLFAVLPDIDEKVGSHFLGVFLRP